MCDIRDFKVGDIVICGESIPYRQFFYIHNIDIERNVVITSGVKENDGMSFFNKSGVWSFHRKANKEESAMFYDLIERYGFKFNINTGVTRE